ncbi:Alpha/Beta hydrolase protein [Phyllosticta citriasiana]|uniref:Alpha/Beta hydrolase protein n=1 Tax=Phyllosticta citriasiana TaxID=595635 RepID=UPI0030FD9D4A
MDSYSFATEEGWHSTEDGVRLYTKTWKPNGDIKARLVFVHGFSDHCNAYGILFPTLASRGILVYTFDQRGWGRSVKHPSQRGLTGPTSLVLSDITSFMSALPPSPLPLFLMGHSMGGGEVLHYAATGPPHILRQIRGFLCESPFVAFHYKSQPWRVMLVLGRIAAMLAPSKQIATNLDPKTLSRDPVVQQEYVDDELCHDTGTLEGVAGLLDRAAALDSGQLRVKDGIGEGGKTRLWISHGTGDSFTAYAPVKRMFEGFDIEDKQLKLYDGWSHKLHAEPGEDKVIFAKDVVNWIMERVGEANNDVESWTKSKL